MPNPYQDLPPAHFWKTAVAALEPGSVTPIRAKRFAIGDGAAIATAGSCFAQELGRHLSAMPGVHLLRAEPIEAGQALFSARYGNIYTVRQLRQLLERAFGGFAPADVAWRRGDGRHVDPFRPYVFPAGFASAEEMAAERVRHLDAVRRVFIESSVFVFTLGLTEAWRAIADGAVFPVAPGIVSDDIDPAAYEFHNDTYAETLTDLRQFLMRMRQLNPAVRVILTVSPVPLTATYTAEHVLVATAHSKAILRAVCGETDTEFDFAHYFPSYEIVSGHFNRGRYYDPNLRTVTRDGVEHVMRVFRRTYCAAATDTAAGPATLPCDDPEDAPICDEQEIVRSIGFTE